MRIIRFEDDSGKAHTGREMGDGTAELMHGELFGKHVWTGGSQRIRQRRLPFDPVNIFCIGANYREHAKESGVEPPKFPIIFMKPVTAVIGPDDTIVLPKACEPDEVDYECELAVIIGKPGRNIARKDALKHVLGYTCANDVSARKWQKHGGGGQWVRGKGFDTFCPLGPAIVTADDIPDPQKLRISTTLNGEVMQDHTTGDMIFPVAELIEFISRDTTLLPGTVILTGTPQGVGFARKPPVCLKNGDEVVIEIEKIGKLENKVGRG